MNKGRFLLGGHLAHLEFVYQYAQLYTTITVYIPLLPFKFKFCPPQQIFLKAWKGTQEGANDMMPFKRENTVDWN